MGILLFTLALLSSTFLQSAPSSNDQKIPASIEEVTVFLSGAQITRTAEVELSNGLNRIVFPSLSYSLNEKSISISTDKSITLLSLQKQNQKIQSTAPLDSLREALYKIENDLDLKKAQKQVLDYELQILMDNKKLKGDGEKISALEIKQAMDYFRDELTKIENGKIEIQNEIEELNKKRTEINRQIRDIVQNQNKKSAQIYAEIDSGNSQVVTFTISYFVTGASWHPSYDVRVQDITSPLELIYKADIRQSTSIDWNNVELTISSAEPSTSASIPVLETNYLGFYNPSQARRLQGKVSGINNFSTAKELGISRASGVVLDQKTGERLPGVNIVVEGYLQGTATRSDGTFSLSVPPEASALKISFIGYESKTVPIQRNLEVRLESNITGMEEVVVTGYAADSERHPQATRPIRTSKGYNQTAFSFTIQQPYSVPGNGRSKTVAVKEYKLPATYRYYAIPKVRETAYLTAQLTGWEKLNLLPGQTNLYFDQTFVGQSTLEPTAPGDTLQFSLGKDKDIIVERRRVGEFTERNFFGNKVKETEAWDLMVKNSKDQPVNLELLDQIPVSTNEDIDVSLEN